MRLQIKPNLDKLKSSFESSNLYKNLKVEEIYRSIRLFILSLTEFLKNHCRLIVSISLSLLFSLFFMVIGFREFFVNFPFFSQRYFGLLILFLCLTVTSIGSFYIKKSRVDKISIWVQSNLLTFYSFAYYLRINAVNFSFFGIYLNTALVFIPLVLFVFLVNWNLFGKDLRKLHLIVPQIFVIVGQTYSLISLLNLDRTILRNFSQDWLTYIFKLDDFIWLGFCALACALITILSFKLQSLKKTALHTLLLFYILFQFLIAINSLGFVTYWYKTLLFVICWDLFFNPFYQISGNIYDLKYKPKLLVSIFYHAFLISFVLFAGSIVNILTSLPN